MPFTKAERAERARRAAEYRKVGQWRYQVRNAAKVYAKLTHTPWMTVALNWGVSWVFSKNEQAALPFGIDTESKIEAGK